MNKKEVLMLASEKEHTELIYLFQGASMKLILFLCILCNIPITTANTPDCSKHPTFCTILRNKPTIDRSYAMRLSNYIYKASIKYNIPADIYTAMLMQESGYINGATNCTTGLTSELVEERVCQDYGVSMVNYKTARSYGFDIHKLLIDVEYAINVGAEILSWFKKTYPKEIHFWARYNCGTKPNINRETCQTYIRYVKRYL